MVTKRKRKKTQRKLVFRSNFILPTYALLSCELVRLKGQVCLYLQRTTIRLELEMTKLCEAFFDHLFHLFLKKRLNASFSV